MKPICALAILLVLTSCGPAPTINGVDPTLASEIAGIRAIDNHAHPVRPTATGEAADIEYDALPVDNLDAQSDPVRQREKSPEPTEARRKLFGNSDKTTVQKRLGPEKYASWVLDQVGIDIMLANRVAMGPNLPESRFRFVPFADALMYPLNNQALILNSDQKAFFPLEEKLLNRYYSESGVTSKPATLDDYLNRVVRPTLERHKKAGALAEKFEMAYLRTLEIGNPSRADAEKAYRGQGDYKALQDYIFRFIAAESGRLGMGIHIHVAHGGGGYFNVRWANPLLLEPLFNDPALRKTNFVLIHGGWPYTREITPLLTKPNVYLDFSEQTAFSTAHDVAETLRLWLAYVPEKVLYATDAYPFSPELGWEEAAWIANATGREALGRALTAMMNDNEVTRDRAIELAKMVLRGNAEKLYGLK